MLLGDHLAVEVERTCQDVNGLLCTALCTVLIGYTLNKLRSVESPADIKEVFWGPVT